MATGDDFLVRWREKRIRELLSPAPGNQKPRVNLIILTSPHCGFCPIAVKMAQQAKEKLGDAIVLREVSVLTPEGQKLAYEHRIQGVPTILIDNSPAFVGVPPDINSLIAKIKQRLKERSHRE